MRRKYQNRASQETNTFISQLRAKNRDLESKVKELEKLVMMSYNEGGVDMRARNTSDWRNSASKAKLIKILFE